MERHVRRNFHFTSNDMLLKSSEEESDSAIAGTKTDNQTTVSNLGNKIKGYYRINSCFV